MLCVWCHSFQIDQYIGSAADLIRLHKDKLCNFVVWYDNDEQASPSDVVWQFCGALFFFGGKQLFSIIHTVSLDEWFSSGSSSVLFWNVEEQQTKSERPLYWHLEQVNILLVFLTVVWQWPQTCNCGYLCIICSVQTGVLCWRTGFWMLYWIEVITAKLLCFDNDAFTIIRFLLGHKIKISMYFK